MLLVIGSCAHCTRNVLLHTQCPIARLMPCCTPNVLLRTQCPENSWAWIYDTSCQTATFLHKYLFKMSHHWAVLCNERQDSLIFFAFLWGEGWACFVFSNLMSRSVAEIRLSGYPRSVRLALKCEILVLNSISEEFVRRSLSASPLTGADE